MTVENKIILYQDDDEITRVSVRFADEDLWLTQNQLAEIYCTTQENISMHVKNINMKNIISTLLLSAAASLSGYAQQANEAISYYLPTTAVHVNVIIEKTNYTPGVLAEYAQRYMRLDNVSLEPYTTYRIIATNMYTTAEPDASKLFSLELDKNHFINNVSKTEKGLLLAINGEGKDNTVIPTFTPSKPQPILNSKDYMSQDILSATSSAKMAELTANEIFEIRDSRTQLARGEADFMPKDGTQLKLMMSQLDTQEKALMQVFSGVTTKDTTMTTITYLPTSEVEKQPLFRFSKYYGIVDKQTPHNRQKRQTDN